MRILHNMGLQNTGFRHVIRSPEHETKSRNPVMTHLSCVFLPRAGKNTKTFSSQSTVTQQYCHFTRKVPRTLKPAPFYMWLHEKSWHFQDYTSRVSLSVLETIITRSRTSLSSLSDIWVTWCFIQLWIRAINLCWGGWHDGGRDTDSPSAQFLSESSQINARSGFILRFLGGVFCFFFVLKMTPLPPRLHVVPLLSSETQSQLWVFLLLSSTSAIY